MARLKFSISLENFKILKFFNLWALREMGPLRKGSFHSREISRISEFPLESLESGRILVNFPGSGVSRVSRSKSEPPKRGRITGAARKLSKSVENIFDIL